MSQAKVDRYKEEKRIVRKLWQRKRECVSPVMSLAVLSLPVSSAGPVTRIQCL